jgi:hypothetical protein
MATQTFPTQQNLANSLVTSFAVLVAVAIIAALFWFYA